MFIISLCLVLTISLHLYWFLEGLIRPGSLLTPPDEDVHPAKTEKVTVTNVESIFKANSMDYHNSQLDWIHVYSVPQTNKDLDFWLSVKTFLEVHFSPVDYHMFVVFKTNDGMFWAVEKVKENVLLSYGKTYHSVVHYILNNVRPQPVYMQAVDRATVSLDRMVSYLKKQLASVHYCSWTANCQHFSKEIFNKFALDENNYSARRVDLANLRPLFRRLISPLFLLLTLMCAFYDVAYLFNEYGLFVKYVSCWTLILISVMMLHFYARNILLINDIVHPTLIFILFSVLLIESVYSTPLESIIAQSEHYRETFKSVGFISQLWISLSYMLLYGTPMYWALLAPLALTHDLLKLTVTHVAPFLYPLQYLLALLYEPHLKIQSSIKFVSGFVISMFYFTFQ